MRPYGAKKRHAGRVRVVFKAVLWDIDGTLLKTGGAGALAWQRAYR